MADDLEPSGSRAPRPFVEFRPMLRAVGMATDSRKLILACVGLLALQAGWWALDRAFGASGIRPELLPIGSAINLLPDVSTSDLGGAARLLLEPFRVVVSPFAGLFIRGLGVSGWFQSALMAVWAVVVWGIAGGAIARIAVVQAAVDRRIGLGSAARFALGKAASLIGAPLTPMLAVAMMAGGCALFGLATRIPANIGATLAAVLGFVPLLMGVAMALILVGLALGWPLMVATVAAEGEDAPDALSRSYSYVNQRLARYASHVVLALAIGSVGLIAATAFARIVLGLTDWGVSLGAPGGPPSDGRLFWAGVVSLVLRGWAYSYFWSAASILYLILRRDVDGTPWHDVYLPEHDADTFAGTPEPVVTESAPVEAEVA